MGLKSVLRMKYVVKTESKIRFKANNDLNRVFTRLKLGDKWVSDITYIRVNDERNYLTIRIDISDRKIGVWNLSEYMRIEDIIMKARFAVRINKNICIWIGLVNFSVY
jgi:putative transposase